MLNYVTMWMATGNLVNEMTPHTEFFEVKEDMDDYMAGQGGNFVVAWSGQVWTPLNKQYVMDLWNYGTQAQLTFPDPVNRAAALQSAGPPKKVWNTQNPLFANLSSESATGVGPTRSRGLQGGTKTIRLLTYLNLLLNTWQSGIGVQVPKRWIDWLTLLIKHYSRYTPAQVREFLARVDFSAKTFKV